MEYPFRLLLVGAAILLCGLPAYAALEDLGSLLRSSLEHRDEELVLLREELEFARRYVAMEQLRFGDRLCIAFHVESSTLQFPVPPFALQPLIENAIKHAVAPSRDVVTIEVNARWTAGGIALEVTDDGGVREERPASGGTGVGFENLRKRLELIYGDDAGLSFVRNERGARVKLAIPDHNASAGRAGRRRQASGAEALTDAANPANPVVSSSAIGNV